MNVALTSATGFIGSHVLTELHEHGHEVTALLRDAAQADIARARAATPVVIDLYDRRAVTSLLADADGAVHTASPGDATSAGLDSAVVDAVTGAFAGPGKPYLHISGLRVYADNTAISEDSALNAPALVSWKEPIERRVLGAAGMRGAVIVASTAYGDGGRYVIGNGLKATVAELTQGAAVAVGAPGAVPGSDDEARARLGDSFADVLLLDQGTAAARARAELGWHPSHPSLVDEFRHGSYRK
jgi:nucleoside-diphosphate-sugar epimerase